MPDALIEASYWRMPLDIEERLSYLERQNRIYRVLFVFLMILPPIGLIGADSGIPSKLVADSIESHSLTVTNPNGKQAITIEVGDSGSAAITIKRADGRLAFGLSTTPSGEPSLCFLYAGACRILLGEVYRGSKRELSIEIRDKNGKTLWMPEISNPYDLPSSSP